MAIEIVWLAVLGSLLGGYFVLGGYDYGVQVLAPVLGDGESGRRTALAALGPFFLGNEVWLVAFGGVLFGAFPILEGTLLAGAYPLIVAILAGVVLGNAAVQLRSRAHSPTGRRVWDALAFLGGLIPAVAWGLLLGVLLRGVPLGPDGAFHLGAAELLHPFVLLCGCAAATLFAAHGATFLALRTRGQLAGRAAALARSLLPAGALLVAATTVAGVASAGVRGSVTQPVLAFGLVAAVLAALLAAGRWVAREHTGRAFATTCAAVALPVALVGAGLHPYLLASTVTGGSGLTVTEAAADPATLRLLGWFAIPLLPTILAYQFWNWWAFRGRVEAPTYF